MDGSMLFNGLLLYIKVADLTLPFAILTIPIAIVTILIKTLAS